MAAPILTTWDGEALVPAGRHAGRCDKELVVGERYFVEPVTTRNMASHRAYFANIREVWLNLREEEAERFPNAEALRKHALIMTGYCTDSSFACADEETALALAREFGRDDDFPVIQVVGNVVRVRRAVSQKVAEMGEDRWKASKAAVEAYLAGMIGVTPEAVEQNAGMAA